MNVVMQSFNTLYLLESLFHSILQSYSRTHFNKDAVIVNFSSSRDRMSQANTES